MPTATQATDQLFDKYEVIRTLGQGGEGRVYLVRETETGEKWVLKVRHEPIRGTATAGLKLYASQIGPNPHGLPQISLLGGPDEIAGIAYRFVELYPIYWRISAYVEPVAQTFFGAYCRMQSYLLSGSKIALLDTVRDNFMMAADGRFHFVDLGFGIRSAQHPQVVDEGKLGYGFVMMLLSLYNQNLKLEMTPISGYAYDRPCVYAGSQMLAQLAQRHRWIADVLSEVRDQNASIFFDADFYQRISDRLPQRLAWPSLVVGATRLHQQWQKMKTTDHLPMFDKERKAPSVG
jgi:hypothetical protein